MTKPLLVLVALATVMVAALPPATADAQFQVTEIDPPDGGELDVPPEFVHLCFSQAANVEDSESFNFDYQLPNGRRLGLRIVFRADGSCVAVYPGLPDDYPAGEHLFNWRVTAAAGGEETSGSLPLIPVLTAAVIAGASALGALFYLVRRRTGFDLHRPPEEGGQDGH